MVATPSAPRESEPRYLSKRPLVFTISIHQKTTIRRTSAISIDLNMADRADDDEYLGALIPAVQKALDEFRPDILFYVGGADPYCEDQLGGLSLTKEGLKQRDRQFRGSAPPQNPGGDDTRRRYARRVEDTVRIHVNTILAARKWQRNIRKVHRCAVRARAVTARDFRQAIRRPGEPVRGGWPLPNSLPKVSGSKPFER